MSPTMLDIRRVLKWSQIVVNVAVMILSMCVLLPLGYVWKYFNSSCLLNADIFVQVSPNKSVLLNTESTQWGDNSLCFYTTFLPVVVAIHSFIWTWFFVYVRRSLKDGGQDSYLMLPVLVLHGILFVCMAVSSSILTKGFNGWCHTLEKNIQNKYTCTDLQNMHWALFHGTQSFYTFYQVAEASSWLLTIALASQCGLTLYRSYREWTWEEPSPDKDKTLLEKENAQCGAYAFQGMDTDTGSLNFTSEVSVPVSDSGRSSLPGRLSSRNSSRKSHVV
ncbi:transmembrane protein 179-like [Haliotis rufescens]|uniref:transmembrane protein 179-like n=1 Tax=Haliotis rufescens TaxID=6454 RepID=UPI001EB05EB6|nr:transmembrane protein 179-like [Haliotis rufescens]